MTTSEDVLARRLELCRSVGGTLRAVTQKTLCSSSRTQEFGNTALEIISGPRNTKLSETRKNTYQAASQRALFTKYYTNQIKGDMTDGSHGMQGRYKKCI